MISGHLMVRSVFEDTVSDYKPIKKTEIKQPLSISAGFISENITSEGKRTYRKLGGGVIE